jgi:hypothetical protein
MSSDKVGDQKRLEELYPGKLAIIKTADFQTIKNETALFKRTFEVEHQESGPVIYAGADAVLWGPDEKSVALEIRHRLNAFSGWGESLRDRCEILGGPILSSHDYSSYTSEHDAISSLLSILASTGKDISSAALELAKTMLGIPETQDMVPERFEQYRREYNNIRSDYEEFLGEHEKYITAKFDCENWSDSERQCFLELFPIIRRGLEEFGDRCDKLDALIDEGGEIEGINLTTVSSLQLLIAKLAERSEDSIGSLQSGLFTIADVLGLSDEDLEPYYQ